MAATTKKAPHLEYHAEEETKVFLTAFKLIGPAQRCQAIKELTERKNPEVFFTCSKTEILTLKTQTKRRLERKPVAASNAKLCSSFK